MDQRRHIRHRRRQDQPGQRALAHALDHLLGQVRIAVVAGTQQQAVVERLAGLERAVLDVDDVVVAGVVVDQRDDVGALAGQPPRGGVGTIVEHLHRLDHLLPRLLADVRLVVQHTRDGLDRHARVRGNIINGNGSGAPLHALADVVLKHAAGRTQTPASASILPSSASPRRQEITESADDRAPSAGSRCPAPGSRPAGSARRRSSGSRGWSRPASHWPSAR